MPIQSILAILYNVVLIAVCGFAVLRGGRPERQGAVMTLIASIVSGAIQFWSVAYWEPAQIVILAVDISVAIGFFWLAVSTIRYWPIWAFGFALANLFIGAAGAILPNITLFAYSSGVVLYAYLALGALAFGTLRLPRDASFALRHGSRRLWQQQQPENQSKDLQTS